MERFVTCVAVRLRPYSIVIAWTASAQVALRLFRASSSAVRTSRSRVRPRPMRYARPAAAPRRAVSAPSAARQCSHMVTRTLTSFRFAFLRWMMRPGFNPRWISGRSARNRGLAWIKPFRITRNLPSGSPRDFALAWHPGHAVSMASPPRRLAGWLVDLCPGFVGAGSFEGFVDDNMHFRERRLPGVQVG